ncbi:MAG: hypothetical protein NT001_02795 [Candidatus Woesearchaeota archaeon]|nr:hypothetical protein [Candidatus Woesearchaeota archaeon]
MFSKRGISQTDWVISLAIFLVYLAWFFVVITPALNPDTKGSLPVDDLKARFMVNASWQVNVTPIFLKSNISSSKEPIILDFNFAGNALNYAVKEAYWVIDSNRLFFLAGFPPEKARYNLVHSSSNYTKPDITSGLYASETEAKTSDMTAEFENGIIKEVRYKDSTKIFNVSIYDEGYPISSGTSDFLSDKILARYRTRSSLLNNSFYVFDGNPGIYGYVDTGKEKSVDIHFKLKKYDEFYINRENSGNIDYNATECDSFNTDFIDFLDSGYGAAFVFGEKTDIEMCHNRELILKIKPVVASSFSYKVIFHDAGADYDDIITPYTAVFGIAEIFDGLSGEKMLDLRSSGYPDLKHGWKMKNDFNITVFNSTATLLRVGTTPMKNVNVYSKMYYVWMLDKYANQTREAINILMW